MKKFRNVDLFNLSMTTRINEYAQCRILRKKIGLEYADRIAAVKASVEGLAKLEGSALWNESVKDEIEKKQAEILRLEDERKEQLKKDATFTLTKADRGFKKALHGLHCDDDKVALAVVEWFDQYSVDVRSSYLLKDILRAIGGKESFGELVSTDGRNAVVVDETRALNMLYWVTFGACVEKGAIKAAVLPEIIREKYAPKPKKSAKKDAEKVAA